MNQDELSPNPTDKKRKARIFRPLRLFIIGCVAFVISLILIANIPDANQNSAEADIAGLLILLAFLVCGLAVLMLLIRLIKRIFHSNQISGQNNPSTQPVGPKPKLRHRKTIIGFAVLVIVIVVAAALAYRPISDKLTIDSADPAMVALAQQAGMSRDGELVFLRSRPQLVSDAQLVSDCNAAANNSNGFIEQGCYVPETNRIYLRQMPDDLHNLEVSTAAYEMLHPVYISLHGSSQGTALDQAIESNFTATNDSLLQSQVANFAKTEPGAKDLELFSLLGTGYSNLSSSLSSYYTPYFDNIGATVAANNQVNGLFQNYQTQISQLQASIQNYDNLANTAYSNSASWAYAGNQYEDDYNYNIYVQDIKAENNTVDQYNQLLGNYNKLVAEYNGQQLTPIQASQTQDAQ